MSWAKLDDQLHAHRKAKIAWKAHPRALGMHLLALSYCAGHLTDGLVDEEFVEEKVPAKREREQVTDALVKAGLWTREDDGWRINDWLDYNPSRADVLDRRHRDSERKKRKDSTRNPSGVRLESVKIPDDPSRAPAFPDPTRPQLPPSPPQAGGRKRDRERWEETALAWAGAACVSGPREELLTALRRAAGSDLGASPEAFRAFVDGRYANLLVAA
jgi:hypothetical protein